MNTSGDRSSGVWFRVKALGSGAFGVVELWRNKNTSESRAIKRCHLDVSKMTGRQIERWNDEVEFMNIVQHPNIVGTREIPQEAEDHNARLPVLCMEFCSKGDLRDALMKFENFWGLSERECLRVMEDIASAVEYLHSKGITHRDLKPQNIVIQNGKSGTIYKLIDLGYAKELGEASTSASIVGTLNYVAPELFWKKTYSSSVDYWSLGILFYEILKGIRPFLPNMGFTKNWVTHISKKGPDDICAREIHGRVEFSSKIDDPSNASQCLRDNLIPWFRLVLRWDPKTRGKHMENGQPSVAVFKVLKAVLAKKILHLFFVSSYKRESYFIDESTTISEVKRLIFDNQKIEIADQLLVTSEGKLLENSELRILSFCADEDEVIVFEKEKLLIDDLESVREPEDVQMMKQGGIKACDYQTLKIFCGATVFFIKQELELYKSYLIALSIKIDLCDTNYQNLPEKVEKMLFESIILQEKIQEMFPDHEEDVQGSRKLQNSHQLRRKLTNFISSSRGMKSKLKNLLDLKEKWKAIFSSLIDFSRLSDILEEAEQELKLTISADPNKLRTPKKMVEIYFRFLRVRHEMLSCERLKEVGTGFIEVERELLKLEISLKSFEMMLGQYQRDFADFEGVNQNASQDWRGGTSNGDVLVRDNIVLGHLISGLLTEMEDIRAKLGSLD